MQCLYSASLPSPAIRQILPFLTTGVATDDMRGRLEQEHNRLQRQIEELTVARDRLAIMRRKAATA